MTWQDIVIAIGQFGFTIAMIPTVLGKQKPAGITNVYTAICLSIFGVCFATLSLWLSAIGVWSSALAWWILVEQTFRSH